MRNDDTIKAGEKEESNNAATHPLVHLLGANLLDLGDELVKARLHLRQGTKREIT